MAMDNVMHGTTTRVTYQNKTMPINEEGYLIPIGNQGIFVILVKKIPLHNLECTKLPIVTSQGNYSHSTRTISSILRRFVIIKPYVNIHVRLTTWIPSHNIFPIKLIPLNLRGDLLEPIGSVIVAYVQLVIPYSRPYKKPFNYLKYKKNFDPNAHVRVFKATIKANYEMIDEEISNWFNFTSKDNGSNWCNNYMQDHPNCKFANLK
jgi:hypothetical protein